MKINVEVSNLGPINKSDFKIRPITLLTGCNGTGKSFFTKSLYSILNVLNLNIYHLDLLKRLNQSELYLDRVRSRLSYAGKRDYEVFNEIEEGLFSVRAGLVDATETLELKEYFEYSQSQVNKVDEIIFKFERYLSLLSSKSVKLKSILHVSGAFNKILNSLREALNNATEHYTTLLQERLSDEIKENFQVSDLTDLISFDEPRTKISLDGLASIDLTKGGVEFNIKHDFITKISTLSRVVFFESPAYWKVRDALKMAKENSRARLFLRKNSSKLSGVPKYFYDLDETLKEKVKDHNFSAVDELSDRIEEELGGEFVFSGDDLVFKDKHSSREVSKHLISFGMTNLGMILALLKNNVISSGSFVFIDEPETNLHPEWQVLLMGVLIELARKEVNIIVATHSVDMLKALEVGLSEEDEELLSVHYFDTDGSLMKFESQKPKERLIEAREMLTAPYEALYYGKTS